MFEELIKLIGALKISKPEKNKYYYQWADVASELETARIEAEEDRKYACMLTH